MRRKFQNEGSRPLNQTQPTSVNSSCQKGIQRNQFFSKNVFRWIHLWQLEFTEVN